MEIFLLSFTAGAAVAIIIAGIGGSVRAIGLSIFLAVFVFSIWFGWATQGAIYFVEKFQERGLSQFISGGIAREQMSTTERQADSAALLQALGQAGDLFGGINALFAALAFVGVAIAAVIQGKTLQISLNQQRQQSFEPLFFHLLDLHRNVAVPHVPLMGRFDKKQKAVRTEGGVEPSVGFTRAMKILRYALRRMAVALQMDANGRAKLKQACNAYYTTFYDANQDELGPHFRSLYQVFKLIDNSAFEEHMKIRYANIARSTLGKDQLFLLAVNCASQHGAEFKPLVERYGLLKHIARDADKKTIDERVADWCYHVSATLGAKDRQALLDRSLQ